MSSILHEIGATTGRRVCRQSVVGGSADASADPPEAEPGEQDGEPNEDAGLGPLQWPKVAGGVVGEVLAQTLCAEPLLAELGRRGRAAELRIAGDRLAGAGHDVVR